MDESNRLAEQLKLALNGGAWHGPSWRELLEGITPEAALYRPFPSAHNIAEIVLHTTTWHEVVRLRLQGESPQVSDAEDWPRPAGNGHGFEWWPALRQRLFETGESLRETIAAFPPERLHESRPGIDDTWYGLITGALQHVVYHAGQVAILKKSQPAA